MKKLIFIIVLILVGVVFWYTKSEKEPAPQTDLKTYRNTNLGISFKYPNYISASTTNGVIVLHHDIAFENHGECDMVGDEKTYEKLTDFRVTIQQINKGLVDTMKTVSPYIPKENFINNRVVVSPGFIDEYKTSKLTGYAIYEGAEGCGQTAYYFPVSADQTMVITKASIQILSGVIAKEKMAEVLAVPGVLPREKSEEIFGSILESLEI